MVTVHLHDYKTALPRGHAGTMLYMAEQGDGEDDEKQQTEQDSKSKPEYVHDAAALPQSKQTEDFNAMSKSKGKGKDKSKW